MRSPALQALTAAALALPGMAAGIAPARADDSFVVEQRHYDEGERDLNGRGYGDLNLKPIEVDSLAASLRIDSTAPRTFSINLSQDTWSGATPVVSLPNAAVEEQLVSGASSPNGYYTDAQHRPIVVDWDSWDPASGQYQYTHDARTVHLMASASPEVRKQADLKAGYRWRDAAANLGGGVSDEPDYRSVFVGADGSLDFNNRTTTLAWSWSRTESTVKASLQANAAADWGAYLDKIHEANGAAVLKDTRDDWSANLGLTQVLDRESLLSGSVGFTRSSGYLENPYKAVMLGFDDPHQYVDASGIRSVTLKGVLEQRPDERQQWTFELRHVQHIDAFDAALHTTYRLFHDDWHITAHTLDLAWYQPLGDGWMLEPSLRYYMQTQADFYGAYFVFNQPYPVDFGSHGFGLDHSKLRRDTFSSDQRLSAFGALSGGLKLRRQLSDDVSLDLTAEYYRHAGSLKIRGGEEDFADFDYWVVGAGLDMALGRPDTELPFAGAGARDTARATPAAGNRHAPAGVTLAVMPQHAGEFHLGYAYTMDRQRGAVRRGTHGADDTEVMRQACDGVPCDRVTESFDASEHRFELEYALRDDLALAVVPRLVERSMQWRPLQYALPQAAIGIGPRPDPDGDGGSNEATHATGGIGDTDLAALLRLMDRPGQHAHVALAFGVPTGDVDEKLNGSYRFINYGQQLGSGTWDFKPSVVWEGESGVSYWGAQLCGWHRLEQRNDSGYALGDGFSATAWGGHRFSAWFAGGLRAVYTGQRGVDGRFKPHVVPNVPGFEQVPSDYDVNGDGVVDANDTEWVSLVRDESRENPVLGPMDAPGNYGGRFLDVGLDLRLGLPGALAGNQLDLEWLEPVYQDVNGYQARRRGTLSVSWTVLL